MKKPKFTLEQCFLEAKKYQSRVDFFKRSPAAYAALQRHGLLGSACEHMPLSPKYSYRRWDHGAVLAEAVKYKNRAEFRRENQGAYAYALKHGLLNDAFARAKDGHNFWHLFELMAIAVKYQDHGEFIKAEPQAYNFAVKKKLIHISFAHMRRARIVWCRTSVMAEAAKHSSRGLFQAVASGAYKHADKHGYLDKACAHMPTPEYGFSKEKTAVLYHLRMTTPDGVVLYKIGITNRDPAARIAGMGLGPGVAAEILDTIKFDSGRDARMAEKRLHRRLKNHRYSGPPILKNGNTELFTIGILEP